jgi:hypothetical protein
MAIGSSTSLALLPRFIDHSAAALPGPFSQPSVPNQSFYASFWCAVWYPSTSTYSLHRAYYQNKKSIRMQHWIQIASPYSPNDPQFSNMIQLRKCPGCHLHNDSVNPLKRRYLTSNNSENSLLLDLNCRQELSYNHILVLENREHSTEIEKYLSGRVSTN